MNEKPYVYLLLMFILLFTSCRGQNNVEPNDNTPTETEYNVLVDVNESKGTVSPLLMGVNTIYCFEKDELWQDGNGIMPSMLKRFKTGIIRYPGGAVTNRYHWNNLNGQGWQDNWNPNYDVANNMPESEFMDVDEYMVNIKAIGAEPMLGINMGSGMKYDRVQDGIDEAVALVQYCKDKHYNVKYWYLDNEPYNKGANSTMTVTEYAEQINLYVPAMKAVNPDIEIIVNWSHNISIQQNQLIKLIESAGKNIDIVEIHWYWQWGKSTFDLWKNSFPMNTKTQWYNGGSYVDEIKAFRSLVNSLGFKSIKLASNEWNIGPSSSEEFYPSKFEAALMISEMFSQYIDAGLCMSCFWGAYWPLSSGNTVNRYLLDPTDNYSENPTVKVFEMFADAMGAEQVECRSLLNGVYNIAVVDEVNNQLLIYLINKWKSEQPLSTGIKVVGYDIGSASATSFVDNSISNSHVAETDVKVENGNRLIIDLPNNSFTKVIIKR